MKRLIALLLVITMMMLPVTGCSIEEQLNVDNSLPSDQNDTDGKVYIEDGKNEFDEETVKKQLAVKTYSYDSDYWHYGFVEVANNSKYDLGISVNIKFYDADGSLIGAQSASENAFQQGTEMLFYFMPDEKFSSLEYDISVHEEDYYDCVVKDLSYESVTAKEKEIVSVTNNGTAAAEFVEGSMLFFKDDKVVEFDQTYFVDDDSELKPKVTITKELHSYEKYDSYKFYLTGRR